MIEFFTSNGFVISQILVGIAIITDAISFQCKKRKTVLYFLMISGILISLHYLALGQINAFYMTWLSVFSFMVSIFTHDKRVMGVFFILYLFPMFLNYTQAIDILLFLAVYFTLMAKFMKDDQSLRIIFMIASIFAISFNMLIFTPLWIVLEVLFLLTNFVWYYRHYTHKK